MRRAFGNRSQQRADRAWRFGMMMALTACVSGCYTGVEACYWLFGRSAVGTVVEVRQVERRRNHRPYIGLEMEYGYQDGITGKSRRGVEDVPDGEIVAEGMSLPIEYVPRIGLSRRHGSMVGPVLFGVSLAGSAWFALYLRREWRSAGEAWRRSRTPEGA